jgi:hypothetical protein
MQSLVRTRWGQLRTRARNGELYLVLRWNALISRFPFALNIDIRSTVESGSLVEFPATMAGFSSDSGFSEAARFEECLDRIVGMCHTLCVLAFGRESKLESLQESNYTVRDRRLGIFRANPVTDVPSTSRAGARFSDEFCVGAHFDGEVLSVAFADKVFTLSPARGASAAVIHCIRHRAGSGRRKLRGCRGETVRTSAGLGENRKRRG